MNYINVLITIDDNYIDYCYNLFFSLKKNNKSLFNIYLFYSNLSQENINGFVSFINENKMGKVKPILFELSNYDFPNNSDYISDTAYIRLFAPLLIEDKIDRLLYLDPDIICGNSIEEFYNFDFDNKMLIAVENMFHEENYYKNYNLGLDCDNIYVNSGVIIFNMKKYLENVSKKGLLDFINENKIILENHDQDIINLMFYNDIKAVDNTYNYQIISNDTRIDAVLTHYAGSPKPWDNNYEFVEKGIPYYKLLIDMGKEDLAKEIIIRNSINYMGIIKWIIGEDYNSLLNIYKDIDYIDNIYEYLDDFGAKYGTKLFNNLINDKKSGE